MATKTPLRKSDGSGQFNGSAPSKTKAAAPTSSPAATSSLAPEAIGRRPALATPKVDPQEKFATLHSGVASADDVASRRSSCWHKKENDPYRNSPFYELKQMPSKAKGAEFEAIFSDLMECLGHDVSDRCDGASGHDRVVNGNKIEIKGSFLWGKDGEMEFRWSQIRDQEYDYLAIMAFYPDRVEMYYADHKTAMENVRVQDADGNWIYNQHGGKTVDSGTYWISGRPEDFPWLKRITTDSFPDRG